MEQCGLEGTKSPVSMVSLEFLFRSQATSLLSPDSLYLCFFLVFGSKATCILSSLPTPPSSAISPSLLKKW